MRSAHLAFGLLRQPLVVVIEKGDPLTARDTDADVPGFGSATRLGEDDDAQTRIVEGIEASFGFPIWTIDHDDNFQIGPGLPQRTTHRKGQQTRPCPRWNHRGYKWVIRS